jgi:hypothetical protein
LEDELSRLSGVDGSEDVSRGTNSWNGSGDVITDVTYSRTRSGDEACSFRIAVNQAHKPTLYLRINVYGGNVIVCRKRNLGIGDFVVIDGELMNRKGKDDVLIEVRCQDIVIRQSEGVRNAGQRQK